MAEVAFFQPNNAAASRNIEETRQRKRGRRRNARAVWTAGRPSQRMSQRVGLECGGIYHLTNLLRPFSDDYHELPAEPILGVI